MGRPRRDPLVVSKLILLQHFYNLSNPQAESQVNDRLSFRRFCGLSLAEAAPDETTLVGFHARLREHGLDGELFERINAPLGARGLMVRATTVVDATLISAWSVTARNLSINASPGIYKEPPLYRREEKPL